MRAPGELRENSQVLFPARDYLKVMIDGENPAAIPYRAGDDGGIGHAQGQIAVFVRQPRDAVGITPVPAERICTLGEVLEKRRLHVRLEASLKKPPDLCENRDWNNIWPRVAFDRIEAGHMIGVVAIDKGQ